jgi:hypothetical protein
MVCQRHFNMPGADAEPGLRQSEDSDGPVPLGPLRETSRLRRKLQSTQCDHLHILSVYYRVLDLLHVG